MAVVDCDGVVPLLLVLVPLTCLDADPFEDDAFKPSPPIIPSTPVAITGTPTLPLFEFEVLLPFDEARDE